ADLDGMPGITAAAGGALTAAGTEAAADGLDAGTAADRLDFGGGADAPAGPAAGPDLDRAEPGDRTDDPREPADADLVEIRPAGRPSGGGRAPAPGRARGRASPGPSPPTGRTSPGSRWTPTCSRSRRWAASGSTASRRRRRPGCPETRTGATPTAPT